LLTVSEEDKGEHRLKKKPLHPIDLVNLMGRELFRSGDQSKSGIPTGLIVLEKKKFCVEN
jgi:hypothetical protein